MEYHPKVDWGGRVVVSTVILGLRPPVPIAFDDPHQLHSYPRLHVHLPSARRVVARSSRLCSARRGLGSCGVFLFFPGVAEHIANRSRAHSHLR